jgi:hypothetical protein
VPLEEEEECISVEFNSPVFLLLSDVDNCEGVNIKFIV